MPDVLDDERHEAVCDALARGATARVVARQFGLQEREVRVILQEEAKRCFDGERLREQVALEVRRVRTAALKYYNKGIELPNGELAMGIYFKGVERLMYMLGANAPQQHAVHLMTQAAEPESSTKQLMRVMDEVLNIGPKERLLEDKALHAEPMTPEEINELEQFRKEREAREDVERERNRRERADQLAARRGNGGAAD